jgi:hypothetical protein
VANGSVGAAAGAWRCSSWRSLRPLPTSWMQEAAREADAARRAAEDSAAGQAAALAATRRRADTYREENRALLANYDDWLRTLVMFTTAATVVCYHGYCRPQPYSIPIDNPIRQSRFSWPKGRRRGRTWC